MKRNNIDNTENDPLREMSDIVYSVLSNDTATAPLNMTSEELYQTILKGQKRRNALFDGMRPDDKFFGYSAGNPILTSSIPSSAKYLSRLYTLDGEKLYWFRYGAMDLEELHGVEGVIVDIYDLYLNGKFFNRLYICPYGHSSTYVPKGMMLGAEEANQNNGNIAYEAKEKGMSTEQFLAFQALEYENAQIKAERKRVEEQQKILREESNKSLFCRKCGTKLPPESSFCYKCGEKVITLNSGSMSVPQPAAHTATAPTESKTVRATIQKDTNDLTPVQQRVDKWYAEGEKLKKMYPSFDFRAEANNKDFLELLKRGFSVQQAYELIHRDDLKTPPQPATRTATAPATPQPPKVKKSRKYLKWLLPVLAVLLAIATLLYLNQDFIKSTFVYEVSINATSELDMFVGATQRLRCTTYPKEIESDIVWKSSDTSVATVSSTGIVTAKDEGTAKITVSINGILKDSCTVHVILKTVNVKNGQLIVSPRSTGYPEVTVNAPKNANCFVYFENIYNSANDFAFYVTAGSSATVNAPAGTYNFYYATGDHWYGKELKFGKDTNFFKSPDTMILAEDSTGYDVIELTLYAVPNGNWDTDPINENEFPI